MVVFLLTTGDGSDGDEWYVVGIYSTKEKADRAKSEHDSKKIYRQDGSFYVRSSNEIEEWPVDPTTESHA